MPVTEILCCVIPHDPISVAKIEEPTVSPNWPRFMANLNSFNSS
jgi:hypothetical protein